MVDQVRGGFGQQVASGEWREYRLPDWTVVVTTERRERGREVVCPYCQSHICETSDLAEATAKTKEHVLSCDKHPAFKLKQQRDGLLAAVELLKATLLNVLQHAPSYDWNADPLSLTLVTGTACEVADRAVANAKGGA